jgi:hypothetical protein
MPDGGACPLCGSERTRLFAHSGPRSYFDCGVCRLAHLAPRQRLAAGAERRHYETHENDPSDAAYRAFLERLAAPMAAQLPAGARGLDYGAGPGPTLSVMLEERGFPMAIYDPIYAPDRGALRQTYDFISCSETVEHFFSPSEEFERLQRLLWPGGCLGVMTPLLMDDCVFESWYYARDPTHVCFYRPATMHWLAERHGWTVSFPSRNVILFRKSPAAGPASRH